MAGDKFGWLSQSDGIGLPDFVRYCNDRFRLLTHNFQSTVVFTDTAQTITGAKTFTSLVTATAGLKLSGSIGTGGLYGRSDAALELQEGTTAGPIYSMFMTLNPGSTSPECGQAYMGYNAGGTLRKVASFSAKWAVATAGTARGILRFNATKNDGSDSLEMKIYGGNGIWMFGGNDVSGPGDKILGVLGTQTLGDGDDVTRLLNLKHDGADVVTRLRRSANTLNALVEFTTSTTQDWLAGLRQNSDSDFHIYSYGTATDVLVLSRSTGAATFVNDVLIPTGSLFKVNGVQHTHVAADVTDLATARSLMAPVLMGTLTVGIATGTLYAQLFASQAVGLATDALAAMICPRAGTLKNFTVVLNTAQPATGTDILTVRKNGADSGITVTVAANAAAGTVYADTTHTLSVAVNDVVDLKMVNGALTASAALSWATIYDA